MVPVRVGLVGTGYAAKLRAESLVGDRRAQLVAVAGHTPERVQALSQSYKAEAVASWAELVNRPDIDLVIVSNANSEHAAIGRAALQSAKHTIIEYPLALEVAEAEALLQLAAAQNKLLHVEHIELLSGVHLALKAALPEIGRPLYVRYASLKVDRPAPQKWTYSARLFGFPLLGAVSRIHRLTNLFGAVQSVSCQSEFWYSSQPDFFTSCLCTAQLRFQSGLIAEVIYGKGEAIWQAERSFQVQGSSGAIVLQGDEGQLLQAHRSVPLDMGSRRGLFAKDMAMVLDHLTTGAPLYITALESLEALRVAAAAQQSAETGRTVFL